MTLLGLILSPNSHKPAKSQKLYEQHLASGARRRTDKIGGTRLF